MALSLSTLKPSLLRLMAELILHVSPCSLTVPGPGRPRTSAWQAPSVLCKGAFEPNYNDLNSQSEIAITFVPT